EPLAVRGIANGKAVIFLRLLQAGRGLPGAGLDDADAGALDKRKTPAIGREAVAAGRPVIFGLAALQMGLSRRVEQFALSQIPDVKTLVVRGNDDPVLLRRQDDLDGVVRLLRR